MVLLNTTPKPSWSLPVFVVIIITPFTTLEPYNADAAPPFKTLADATSSEFKLEIPSPPSDPPHKPAEPLLSFPTGIPSIIYSG